MKKIVSMFLAMLIIFPSNLIIASTENREVERWISVDMLMQWSNDDVETFVKHIREHLRYSNPEEYETKVKGIARIYQQFQKDPATVPLHALEIADVIFTRIRTDYIRDRQMTHLNRLMWGVVELSLAIGLTVTGKFGDTFKRAWNKRYLELKPKAIEAIETNIGRLAHEVELQEGRIQTITPTEGDGGDLAKKVRDGLNGNEWRDNREVKKQLAKDRAQLKKIRQGSLGTEGRKYEEAKEKELKKLQGQLDKNKRKIEDIGTGRKKTFYFGIPHRKFLSPGGFWDFLLSGSALSGPRTISREFVPQAVTKNIELLFDKTQAMAKAGITKNGQEFEDVFLKANSLQEALDACYADLSHELKVPPGTTLDQLSPRKLLRVSQWFEREARTFEINVTKLKKGADWTRFYQYDRLVYTGDIFAVSATLGFLGGASIMRSRQPQNWWFESDSNIRPGALRKDPKDIVEEVVGKDFFPQYEGRLEQLNLGLSENLEPDSIPLQHEFEAVRANDRAKQALVANAVKEIRTEMGDDQRPVMPQPERSDDWSFTVEDVLGNESQRGAD